MVQVILAGTIPEFNACTQYMDVGRDPLLWDFPYGAPHYRTRRRLHTFRKCVASVDRYVSRCAAYTDWVSMQ